MLHRTTTPAVPGPIATADAARAGAQARPRFTALVQSPLRAGLLRNEWLISAMAIIGVCAHRCARACAHIAHARTHRSRVYALFLKIAASQCTHARTHTTL